MAESRGSLRTLLNDSVIYGLSGVISRFISIFLTPLYTRVYLPSDYAVLGILNNGFALVSIILVFSLDNSTARWFYDIENADDRKRTINTWVWFYFTGSLLFAALFFITAPWVSELLFSDKVDAVPYIRLMALTLPLQMWLAIANNVLRFERKAVATVSMTLIYSLVLIGLNVLFVLVMDLGLIGAYYAQLLGAVVAMLMAVYMIRHWLGSWMYFEWTRLKAMVVYSFPFVPATIAFWLVNLSGVFFVNAYLNETETGLYQIGTSIAAAVGLATTAFQQAWSPFAFSIMHKEEAKTIYAKVLEIYVIVVGGFCLMVSLFAPEALMLLATPKYYDAAWVASILTFSYFAIGLTSIADLGTAIAKKTAPLGFISTVSAAVLVLLYMLLIPSFGKEGAAVAICFSQLIIPVYMFFKSKKVYPIPYNFKNTIALTALFASIAILGRLYVWQSIWVTFSIKFLMFLFVTSIMFWMYKSQLMGFYSTLRRKNL